jgi:hypothetical protein
MILVSNNTRKNTKRKNLKTDTQRRNKRKTKHRETDCKEKIDQVGLQETPHLQDCKQNHSEYSECQNSKKEFFLIEQPSSH